jgi:glutathione S-transferase
MTMKVLGRADSLNVRKVLWAVSELGASVDREDYGGPFGKTDTPDYLKMNPNGLVPTLVDGETTIWESNTIIRYLAAVIPNDGFMGRDASSAARISQWMDWQLASLNPHMQALFNQIVKLGDKGNEKVIEDSKGAANRLLNDVLARSLPDEGFLGGSKVTAGDVCVGVMLHRYVSLLGTSGLADRITAYHKALADRPGFKTRVAIGKP